MERGREKNFKRVSKQIRGGINLVDCIKNVQLYCEKYGIIEYKIIKKELVYYASYPIERNTYKCIVNLDSMEEKRYILQRYYKNGLYNT